MATGVIVVITIQELFLVCRFFLLRFVPITQTKEHEKLFKHWLTLNSSSDKRNLSCANINNWNEVLKVMSQSDGKMMCSQQFYCCLLSDFIIGSNALIKSSSHVKHELHCNLDIWFESKFTVLWTKQILFCENLRLDNGKSFLITVSKWLRGHSLNMTSWYFFLITSLWLQPENFQAKCMLKAI